MSRRKRIAQPVGFALGVFGLIASLVIGCASFNLPSGVKEDTDYLTPVSTQTIEAFRFDSPIEDKTRAVIAARIILNGTRLRSQQAPKVTSVEELSLAEAKRRMPQAGLDSYQDISADASFWLVVFRSEWQVFPPDPLHTITPAPASAGCVYVLMEGNDPGRSQVGSIACIN